MRYRLRTLLSQENHAALRALVLTIWVTLPALILPETKAESREIQPNEKLPLDLALESANASLARIAKVEDYTCRFTKQERLADNRPLIEEEFDAKVRCRKIDREKVLVPFSIHLTYVAPKDVKGRQVSWVEGQNAGKLILQAKPGGVLPTLDLDPNGIIARKGQLHSICDFGIENLVASFVVRLKQEQQQKEFSIEAIREKRFEERVGTLFVVTRLRTRPSAEFHKAEVLIDDELQVPTSCALYGASSELGGNELPLIARYAYTNIKFNVGLKDADFW